MPDRVWLVWEDYYDSQSVVGVFSTEVEAGRYAKGRRVTDEPVWDVPPDPWTYWHVGAEVYPDGHVRRWESEHDAEGEVSMQPCDDHLNTGRVWGGHTQGHCGEHISIFGTDLYACVLAREKHVEEALARQGGVCRDTRHREPADGVSIFDAGFMRLRDAGAEAGRPWECPHDWDEWSGWRDVGSNTRNRQRICRKCITAEVAVSWDARVAVAAPREGAAGE